MDEYWRQVVDLVITTGRTAMSVAAELGIRHTLISRWMRRYGKSIKRRRRAKAPDFVNRPTARGARTIMVGRWGTRPLLRVTLRPNFLSRV